MSQNGKQGSRGATPEGAARLAAKAAARAATTTPERSGAEYVDAAFARSETEDDDGYDPWSDRPARREPLFVEDPWR